MSFRCCHNEMMLLLFLASGRWIFVVHATSRIVRMRTTLWGKKPRLEISKISEMDTVEGFNRNSFSIGWTINGTVMNEVLDRIIFIHPHSTRRKNARRTFIAPTKIIMRMLLDCKPRGPRSGYCSLAAQTQIPMNDQ